MTRLKSLFTTKILHASNFINFLKLIEKTAKQRMNNSNPDKMPINPEKKTRIITVISLLVIIPAGFYTKFYKGPAGAWIGNSLGGLLYVIFWCLIIFLIIPRARIWKIAGGVLIITCLLECLQLYHPPFLNYLRSFFIGQAVLGNSFNPADFMYYIAGSIAAYLWILLIKRI